MQFLFKKKGDSPPANARPSVSQKDSAENRSNLTILDPQESPATISRVGDLITIETSGDFWNSRAEFIFATLVYCLNMGNLWRFPNQVMRYGEGAFLYVYIILTVVFGIPLLFFEVAIGQYTNSGLMKVFHIIPLMEGISTSLVFFSNVMIHIFNMIVIFNFIYFFSFVRTRAPLSSRDHYGELCFYENRTNSIESLHFLNEVLMVSDDLNCSFNARNLCVIFVIWLTIWAFTTKEYTEKKHFTMTIYIGTIIILTISMIASITVKGAKDGVIRLLTPPLSNFLSYKLYAHAFEQVLITLGLAMGPLIHFGSYTPFRTPINIDAITITGCTLISTCFMTIIVFAAVGAYHDDQGYSDAILTGQEYFLHVLLSKIFIRLPPAYKNLNIFLFYGAFLVVGFNASVKYTELLVHFVDTTFDPNPKYNSRIIFSLCMIQFLISIVMISEFGVHLLDWGATNLFLVFSVLILMAVEVSSIIFIYKTTNFCEDLEFMIGRKPNWWFKIVWYITPFVCVCVILVICTEFIAVGIHLEDLFALILHILVVWIPILSTALYSFIIEYRKGEVSRVFYPREVETTFQDYMNWRETQSANSSEPTRT